MTAWLGNPIDFARQCFGFESPSEQQIPLWPWRYEFRCRSCFLGEFEKPIFQRGCGTHAIAWNHHGSYSTHCLPCRRNS